MGKRYRGHPRQFVLRATFAPGTELVNDPSHLHGVPDHRRIGQQTQAGSLVHDLLVVANLKRTLVRAKEPPGELMVALAPAELELYAPPKLDVVDIRYPVVEAGDVSARLRGLRTTGNIPATTRTNLKIA
jgi:hypothetical protein